MGPIDGQHRRALSMATIEADAGRLATAPRVQTRRPRDANREPLNALRQPLAVGRLHEQVYLVRFERVVHETEPRGLAPEHERQPKGLVLARSPTPNSSSMRCSVFAGPV